MRSIEPHTFTFMLVALLACIVVWGDTTMTSEYQTQIRLKNATNTAYKLGEVAGHNKAMQFLADQCKAGFEWSWEGDGYPMLYSCKPAGITTHLMVDTREWIPYINMNDKLRDTVHN